MHTFAPTVQYWLDTVYECTSEGAAWSAAQVEYPCGLLITTSFMFEKMPRLGAAIGFAHQRHHDKGHIRTNWQLIDHIEVNEETGAVCATAWCNCETTE